MGTQKEQELTMHGLKHATGFIQSKLAARLQTRFTPQLRFEIDEGVKKSIEVTRLINEALGQSASSNNSAELDARPAEPTDGTAAQDPEQD
jgi:ribosome-binding factor A